MRKRPIGTCGKVAVIIYHCDLKENIVVDACAMLQILYASFAMPNQKTKCGCATLTHHFGVVCL